MAKYRVILHTDTEDQIEDELFETEDEATEYGLYCCSCYRQGAEILNMSNPGDYPLDEDDEMTFDVEEVDEK